MLERRSPPNMFQFNPDVNDLIQKLNQNLPAKIDRNLLTQISKPYEFFILVFFAGLIGYYQYKKYKDKKRQIEPKEDRLIIYLMYSLIALTIVLAPYLVIQKTLMKDTNLKIEEATSIIEQYNLTNDNQIKETNGYWLYTLSESNPVSETQLVPLEKRYDPKYSEKPKPTHYIQQKPAQDDNSILAKTKILTQSKVKKQANYETELNPNDVHLIKIETIDNQTMVTAHVKVNGQKHKVEVSELVLDKMLQSKTAFYYDAETKQLVIGV